MRHVLPLVLVSLLPGPAHVAQPAGDSFWDHAEATWILALSPDGKLLATTGPNLGERVVVWDMTTLKLRTVLCIPPGTVTDLTISADGKYLATAATGPFGETSTIRVVAVWQVATGRRLSEADMLGRRLFAVRFSPDGKTLAVARADGIALIEMVTGKQRRLLRGHDGEVRNVQFSPDGKMLASTSMDGTVKLWDAATGREKHTLPGHALSVGALAFAPDGKTLANGGGHGPDRPGQVNFWDVVTGKPKGAWYGFDGPVVALGCAGDGKTLAVVTRDGEVTVCAWPSGEKRLEFIGPYMPNRLAYAADGKWLVVLGNTELTAGRVQIWNALTGRQRLSPAAEAERARREAARAKQRAAQAKVRAERERVRAEAQDRAGAAAKDLFDEPAARARRAEYALAVAQARDSVQRWEFRTARTLLDDLEPKAGAEDLRGFEWYSLRRALPREVKLVEGDELPPHPQAAVAPTGRLAAFPVADGIALHETATGKRRFLLKGRMKGNPALAFAPDGALLASGDFGGSVRTSDITLWDTRTGRALATLRGHQGHIWRLCFSPDGKTLGSASHDNTVRLWDVASRKPLRTLTGKEWIFTSVAFSPDGRVVASGTAFHGAQLWDVATGKERCALRVPRGGAVRTIAFAPDGHEVMTGGDATCVWDVATGKLLRVLPGEPPRQYTPDGRSFLAGLHLLNAGNGRLRAAYQFPLARRLPGGEHALDVALTADGRVVAVTGTNVYLRFVEFPLQSGRRFLDGAPATRYGLTFSADGRRLIALGDEDKVTQWDGATGKRLPATAAARPTRGAEAIFPLDNAAFVRLDGQQFTLADFCALRGHARIGAEKPPVRFLGLCPQGKTLVTAAEGEVTVRDAATGKVRAMLPKFAAVVSAVAFARDGKRFATWADDVVLWEAATGKEVARFEPPAGVYNVRFAADGRSLATLVIGNDGISLRLWDVATGEVRATLRGHTGRLSRAVWSPDGNVLATAGDDGTVRLWDAVTGHARGVLRGYPEMVHELAFRPDGRALAVTNIQSGPVTLWVGSDAD